MFGFFSFAWPQFADVPVFAASPIAGDDGAGSNGKRRRRKSPEVQIEAILISFLNTQP